MGNPSFEKICNPGEVAVQYKEGGSACEEPDSDDPTCPDDDEILLKDEKAGTEECFPNVYQDLLDWRSSQTPTT